MVNVIIQGTSCISPEIVQITLNTIWYYSAICGGIIGLFFGYLIRDIMKDDGKH